MKIIVCLKEVIDPTLSLEVILSHPPLMVSLSNHVGLPLKLNPHDAASFSLALDLKSRSESPVEITLISIGPERVESYLRNGIALGADKAVRIWDESFEGLSPFRKARLLSWAVALLGADFVLTGARSLDTGHRQVGPLLAAWLGFPCVGEVVGLELDKEQNLVSLIKNIGRGEREKITCSLPAVITIKGEGKLPYASLDRLIESKYHEITLLSFADLGISPAEFTTDPSPVTNLLFPRPAPRKVPPLDSNLPAFYRILQLLEGGITRRKGLMLEGSPDELAEQLFQFLKEEGVVKSTVDS